MGLLSKAQGNVGKKTDPAELDEMGKALCQRIKRLSQNSSTPYTALSLLKAYGAFQVGICLHLKDGIYTKYSSVGLGIGHIAIPEKKIRQDKKNKETYYKYNGKEKLEICTGDDGLSYWIFDLDSSEEESKWPWKEIMLLGVSAEENPESAFDPQSIYAIIKKTSKKFILDQFLMEINLGKKGNTEDIKNTFLDSGGSIPESMKALKDKISEYHKIHEEFGCILLENPNSDNEEEKNSFCKRISKMLDMTGTVLALENARPLILLPRLLDRELIAHRLSKSFNTKVMSVFEADSPESVYIQIESML